MGKIWERIYPWVAGMAAWLFLYSLKITPMVKGFEKVLDGVITFSSITIGFLGALLAIILSISKSEVIKHLYTYVDINNGKDVFYRYFREVIMLGFFVVIFSIFMYVLKEKYPFPFGDFVFYLWAFSTACFIMSSFRIIRILMGALFWELKSQHFQPYKQKKTLTEEQIENLKNDSLKN